MKAASISEQIKMVKSMIDLLNDEFPINTTGIPTQKYNSDRVLINLKVIPHPHFTAIQSKCLSSQKELPFWWIHCTCYHSWNSENFDHLSKSFKTIALEIGFEVFFAFVFIVGLKSIYDQAKKDKAIFIGKHNPTFIL